MLDLRAGCIALSLACVLATLSSGCRNEPPGTPVGSYQVEGRLLENSCGQTGERFRPSFSFRVELRGSDDAGFWLAGSHPPVPGDLDRNEGRFDFKLEQQQVFKAPGMANEASCVLTQQEHIAGTLEEMPSDTDTPMTDAGMPASPGRLHADNTIRWAALPGTDCSKALAPTGPFAMLPCTARYELEGTRLDP